MALRMEQYVFSGKIKAVLLFVLCPLFLCCQIVDVETEVGDWKILTQNDLLHFEDDTRSLTFSEVLKKEFTAAQQENQNKQAVHWYRFSLINEKNKGQLFMSFRLVDYSDVYVPVKGEEGYRHHTVGFFAKKKEKIVGGEHLQMLRLQTDEIDFSRPFYFNRRMITHWAKNNWGHLLAFFFADDNVALSRDLLWINYKESDIYFYIGVVFISFFLFLVNFLISKNKSYLIYGLYLLGVALYYANRLPIFLNLYQNTIPELYFYVNQIAHIANIGCYTWFVFYFLDFKNAFPKAYKFTKRLLFGILIFGILYTLQIIVFPYFSLRFFVIDAFRVVVMLLSIGLFVFLMFQNPDTIAKIVLIGSMVLIAGNILSLVMGDHTMFLKLMVLEIILFSLVVALRNKEVNDGRLRYRYDLEVEKMKLKTLKELDSVKTRFYENITHEFRTPLTLIISPVVKKLSDPELSQEEREELELIQRNADKLLDLVNQILDLSKLEEGNVKLTVRRGDLGEVIEPLINPFRQEAKNKNIDFLCRIEDIETAWFDKDIIEKVVVNLLSNALKYTPENGSVRIESYSKNGNWIFIITNTVDGDVAIDVSKLFTRYYRASKNIQGTGIGLNITKELVELAKGNIVANTLQNNEIQFTVSLPIKKSLFIDNIADDVDEKIMEVNLSTEVENGNKTLLKESNNTSFIKNKLEDAELPKLLVVEDNPEMRAFIVSNFKGDYQIKEAENGLVGIDLAIEFLPDLIISDIMMPVKNGFELCDAVKQNIQTSHIPVILLTAKVGEENELQGFKTGADDYMTKPFSVKKLKVRVRQLIQNQKQLGDYYGTTFSIDPEMTVSETDSEFLKLLKEVMDGHITDPDFNVDAFVGAMNMSRRQLQRKLKTIIGMSPIEFIRNERVKLAAKLLKLSDATVSEISYQVGFKTPSYFIKCFKETYGCTPSEFSENL
ncbi:helix-turn-helix domain-containing protein [Maribacter sp. MMG018]|uniref:helix-turn-helix domain-containing protein n=1 Tax=Maribacter sp. MMG018 TaxID=2822688 RepID=UPI001B389CB3|nr:helix-turn-helix domain-containing protein [Maribacter sp. MMG018]MBQ4913926.1 helix-turn-helix domain-containing protein [Maribacter sp. MMG018]